MFSFLRGTKVFMTKGFIKKFSNSGQHKYGASKTEVDGILFHSKLEAELYMNFKFMEKAKLIEIIKMQENVKLTRASIILRVDFTIKDLKTNEITWDEAKGEETTDYRIKRKLWLYYGPGKLNVWERYPGGGLRIREVLVPKHESEEKSQTPK
jgi:hypothetical protein